MTETLVIKKVDFKLLYKQRKVLHTITKGVKINTDQFDSIKGIISMLDEWSDTVLIN